MGAPTSAGGVVLTGCDSGFINNQGVAREGDRVFCPACNSTGVIANAGAYRVEIWAGKQVALEGDVCVCQCSPAPVLIAHQQFMCQEIDDPQPVRPAGKAVPNAPLGRSMTPSAPSCVFAKSSVCVPAGSTAAGRTPERIGNFGNAALMASTGTAGTLGQIAGTLGSELGTWVVRGAAGAGSALGVLMLAFWPRAIGDSTLYSAEQLAGMRSASTRVRFQFRRDAAGNPQVYGLHTGPESGMDSVPVTEAHWSADKRAMVAVLDGLSITWTPNKGPVISIPSPFPGVPESLENLLVHPIAPGQDAQFAHYPGQDESDLTWQDTIITFPADAGLPPLYVVFAKPAVRPLEVGPARDLMGRSRGDGLDIDHIPAQNVLEATLLQLDAKMPRQQVLDYLKQAPAIAIPAHVHQRYSETYGGRSTKAKQAGDVADLRAAVDSNVDAIKRGLMENGFAEKDVEIAREQLHQLNQKQGWY
ncbi:S-type pyocin domain-containing protein [Pseudomonas sp. SDO528_S397]